MMSGDNFSDGALKKRAVLGDVTNRPVKWEVSSVPGHLGLKSCGVVIEDEDSCFAKRVCLGVENLVKEKCKTKSGVEGISEKVSFVPNDESARDSSPTDSKIDASQENLVSVISHKPNEVLETDNLLDGNIDFLRSSAMMQSVMETAGDASKDSCADSSGSMATSSGPCKRDCDDEAKITSSVTQSNLEGQGLVSHNYTSDDKDIGVGRLASGKHGSVEWSRLPKSQGSRSFELVRCSDIKGDSCANLNADSLKSCSCSFCLKAAYIWSDLHYQDIKGRIAALKKSQKEASILVNKYCKGKHTDIHVQGVTNKSSKLESDLTVQWKSLFHQMENIFANESGQLQTNFVALRDLREDCKMDLERTTGLPSEKY